MVKPLRADGALRRQQAFNVEQRVNLNLVRSADADQSRIDPERQGRKVLAVVRQADTGV
jgi:hypothetical protein